MYIDLGIRRPVHAPGDDEPRECGGSREKDDDTEHRTQPDLAAHGVLREGQ